jgi:hypothetical protein
MKFWLAMVIGVVAVCAAGAQDAAPAAAAEKAAAPTAEGAAPAEGAAMGNYEKMQIEHVGVMDGTLDGRINKMTGGVKIKLISNKPDMGNLPIRAQSMTFTYAEGASKPTRILLEGDVDIEHPKAHLIAERADWNVEKNEIVFTGNPIVKNEQVKEMRGSKFVLNFETGRFEGTDVRIAELDTSQSGSGGGLGLGMGAGGGGLTETDVTDWPGLIAALKTAAASAEASPGRQVALRGGEKVQSALKSMPTEELLKNKELMLKAINGVIKKPGFYDRDAWASVALGDEVKGLLAKDKLTAAEQARQNLLLLQAAFPSFIAAQ